MTTDQYVEIHHRKPPQTKVTFSSNAYDEDNPALEPWGVLTVSITIGDGNGSQHNTTTKHFLHGVDWRMQAAAIQYAFNQAYFIPPAMTFTEANELLEQKSFTGEDMTELREFIKELCDLIVEAMDDPPRLTPLAGKDWEERAGEAVS